MYGGEDEASVSLMRHDATTLLLLLATDNQIILVVAPPLLDIKIFALHLAREKMRISSKKKNLLPHKTLPFTLSLESAIPWAPLRH